ncbi:hypothetical protein [Paenibacillus guangzhouensis]|uniref:hypothetical protein n=1 Tax=Paenibacillus guangzhouensis TaxID=1473112 RepID=UPI0012672FB5|nr:hypothetical protein [Paenibacillus guangzhouensis]
MTNPASLLYVMICERVEPEAFFSPVIIFSNTIFEKYFGLSLYDDNGNDGDDGRSDDPVGDFEYENGDDACVHDLDVNRVVDRDPFVETLEHYTFLDSLYISFHYLNNSSYVYTGLVTLDLEEMGCLQKPKIGVELRWELTAR